MKKWQLLLIVSVIGRIIGMLATLSSIVLGIYGCCTGITSLPVIIGLWVGGTVYSLMWRKVGNAACWQIDLLEIKEVARNGGDTRIKTK